MTTGTPILQAQLVVDAEGRVWIAGTNVKVIEGVKDKVGYGWNAEVALQALRGEKSQAALCREHNLSPDLICPWKHRPPKSSTSLPAPTPARRVLPNFNGSSGN